MAQGGAISNVGVLTIAGCTLSNNTASGGNIVSGGAIYNIAGAMSISDSTFSGNSAVANDGAVNVYGGAIYTADNGRPVTITRCTIAGNASRQGGGIYLSSSGNAAPVNVLDSTLSGNTATADGGAIFNASGVLSVLNSTLSGNSAANEGGGIDNAGNTTLVNVTVSNNTAGAGGGFLNQTYQEMVWNPYTHNYDVVTKDRPTSVANTILAGNHGPAASPDVQGYLTSQGHNLVGDGTGAGGLTAAGDQVGSAAAPIDPRLGPLQDNGGPTQTMALLPGSPAIDAGDNSLSPGPYDQRGPGYPRIVDGIIDIGAFESQIPYAGAAQAFVVAPDGSLWEVIGAYWFETSPAGTILSVSAAPTAHEGLGAFAVASDQSLWQFVAGAWTKLSPAGTILSASAAPAQQIFAVAADHSLWELSGYGWQMLSPTGTIQGVSATSGTGGVAVAFALAADSSLWQYAGGWTMLSPAGTIRSISAGTQDDVFAVAADQSLWEFNGAAWEMLSPAGTILSIQTGTSATVGDVVFALAADHSLWADGAGGWGLVSPAGTVAAIDELLRTPVGAAESNTQYYGVSVTAWDGSWWYFDAPAGWAPLFPWLTS